MSVRQCGTSCSFFLSDASKDDFNSHYKLVWKCVRIITDWSIRFSSVLSQRPGLRHIFRSSALSSVKKCSHSLIMIFPFNRHVENILIFLTLLERIERERWGRYYIDNSKLWSKSQKPRLAVVVVMVWYRMFISDPIITSTRKTNRNILDFKYFFLPCHGVMFLVFLLAIWAEDWVLVLSKIRANSFKYWHLTDYTRSGGWCFTWRQSVIKH